MKYVVGFHGYFGLQVEVDADSEEEAREKAQETYDNADCGDFSITLDGSDVWKGDD